MDLHSFFLIMVCVTNREFLRFSSVQMTGFKYEKKNLIFIQYDLDA